MHASLTASATLLAAFAVTGCGAAPDQIPSTARATPAASTPARRCCPPPMYQASGGCAGTHARTRRRRRRDRARARCRSDTCAALPAGAASASDVGRRSRRTARGAPRSSPPAITRRIGQAGRSRQGRRQQHRIHPDHWIVLGPFPNPGGRDSFDDPTPDFDKVEPNFHKDFLASSGGEHDVVPKLGTKVTVDKATYEWEQLVASSGETLDIRAHYESTQRAFLHTIAYIADYIQVDEPRKVSFGVGSDDGYMMWVNGEFVTKHHIHRGVTLDDDFVPVSLRKGVNLIVLKVDTDLGGWGALLRIVGKDFAEVHGIKEFALRPRQQPAQQRQRPRRRRPTRRLLRTESHETAR